MVHTAERESAPAVPTTQVPATKALGAFALVAAALTVVVAIADRTGPRQRIRPSGSSWLDGWHQYDAGWYQQIAEHGYSYTPGQQSSIAFFPVYPMGVRALSTLVGDTALAGTLLALLAGAASVVLFARWAWARLSRRSAVAAVGVLLLYPYAMFLYGAMYADSLFLLCAIASFVLLERRWYLAAGLVGALATAGRPVGVAVVVGLVVRTLEMIAQDRAGDGRVGPGELLGAVRLVRPRQLGVLASLLGIGGWCAYLWLQFGDPVAFVAVESAPGWDQGAGPRTWFKIAYAGTMVKGPRDIAVLLTIQAIVCLCAVLLLRRVWQRFGWGYLAYAAVVLAIPILGTKDFMGTGRYALVAFPVLAAAGDYLATRRHRWVLVAVLSVSAALLLVLTWFFGRSVEVS
ncbi:mannosyltransferase family protein [Cellulomonas sp.]|uniref:mannosyltransferase family protein n=1 Tax=Cellulomonas sp. TaxID=40001 RepID=UPI001B05E972|nr:mannosyltransferase family protein [Cellulomonas sp.]MBO9555656.1 hypothetical protein [Cellulomonas sp.]